MLSREELRELQCAVKQVRWMRRLSDYMLALVERTRTHEGLALGVSPRGSQALYRAVQANALVEGRAYALPDDVKVLAPKVLGHRVMPAARSSLARGGMRTARRRASVSSKRFWRRSKFRSKVNERTRNRSVVRVKV